MERRKEFRFTPAEPIQAMVLGDTPAAIPGEVLDISEHGVSLLLPVCLKPGTLIQAQTAEVSLLGEACYCVPHENRFRVGVKVSHWQTGHHGAGSPAMASASLTRMEK